ncbi:hypothetical protein HQ545_06345 [Candidatus Woesearchaeota archaeon]|nr:hypothetical protein [Candidatus Woesearchaeota archaeon]
MALSYAGYYQKYSKDMGLLRDRLELVERCNNAEEFKSNYSKIADYLCYDPRVKTGNRLISLPKGSRQSLTRLIDTIKKKSRDFYHDKRNDLVYAVGQIKKGDCIDLRKQIHSIAESIDDYVEAVYHIDEEKAVTHCREFHNRLLGVVSGYLKVENDLGNYTISPCDIDLISRQLKDTCDQLTGLRNEYRSNPSIIVRNSTNIRHFFQVLKACDRSVRQIPYDSDYYLRYQDTGCDDADDTRSSVTEVLDVPYFDVYRPSSELTFIDNICGHKPDTPNIGLWQNILKNNDCTMPLLPTRFDVFSKALKYSGKLKPAEIDFLALIKEEVAADMALREVSSRLLDLSKAVEGSMEGIDDIVSANSH